MSDRKMPEFVYKALKVFTVVRPGEGPTVFLLGLNMFLILTAYSILKPVRTALILTGQSAEIETYLYGAMAILFVFLIKIFSFLSSKVPRQILITYVTLFFISNLVIFYFLHLIGTPISVLSVIFYIWVGMYNYMLVAQFWGFANDLYTEEAGKRLFPMIMIGQNFGALTGSLITVFLVRPLGAYQMMLVTGGILGICVGLTFVIHRREIKRRDSKEAKVITENESRKKEQEKPLEKGGGFRLVFKSKYLLYIALLIMMLNLVNTTGEYIRKNIFDRTADEAVKETPAVDIEEAKTQFLAKLEAEFNSIVNILALLIQLFLVSRIFKWFGVRGALLFLPFIALGGYFFMAFGVSLVVVRWAKALENSTDYSLMNTVRAALFLTTSRQEKYKAKAAIDTFFVRAGDVLTGIIVFLGTTYFAFNVERFAKFNVVVAVIWIILCFLIIREHKKLSEKRTEYQLE